ncbi:MAG: glycosyltransferase [Hyphomicrobiaceae bacterium]|nr:glycosyltransferase [Hyphomicrobiaceae bacterium]
MEVLRLWARTGAAQMDFLCTSGNRSIFDDEAKQLGAKIHYLRFSRSQLLRFAREFRRILRQGRYRAIHDHQDYASGWHFFLGAGVPPSIRVTHVHNPWLHIEANYAISSSRRLAAAGGKALVEALATHVCGTSTEILRQYGFQPGRSRRPQVAVVHCGFDIDRFNAPRETDRAQVLAEFGWPANTKLVLFAGRLDLALEFVHPQNHKNSWLALNIVREAAARDPAVSLIMAGEGPSRTALTEAIGGWGLAERLRLPGIRQDVPALMRAADVLLFPSAQEGLGMVSVEAQAAGLPVLASQAVPREAVVIADLYEALPLDAPLETWAERLISIMDRPRFDTAACRVAIESSGFSIANSARKLEAIYRSSA